MESYLGGSIVFASGSAGLEGQGWSGRGVTHWLVVLVPRGSRKSCRTPGSARAGLLGRPQGAGGAGSGLPALTYFPEGSRAEGSGSRGLGKQLGKQLGRGLAFFLSLEGRWGEG